MTSDPRAVCAPGADLLYEYRSDYHPDYALELAEWTDGRRSAPPCVDCAGPIPDGVLTGEWRCPECQAERRDA